jgi:hypothetical protein
VRSIKLADSLSKNAVIVAVGNFNPVESQECLQSGMDGVINLAIGAEEVRSQLQKWYARVAFRMWKVEGMPRLTLDRFTPQ